MHWRSSSSPSMQWMLMAMLAALLLVLATSAAAAAEAGKQDPLDREDQKVLGRDLPQLSDDDDAATEAAAQKEGETLTPEDLLAFQGKAGPESDDDQEGFGDGDDDEAEEDEEDEGDEADGPARAGGSNAMRTANSMSAEEVSGEEEEEGEEGGAEEEEEEELELDLSRYVITRPWTVAEKRAHAVAYTKFLAAQAKVFWHTEEPMLKANGLVPGAQVLDIGCGPSHWPQAMLEAVPTANITCVEFDNELATIGRARMRKYIDSGNFRIVHHDATKMLELVANGTLATKSFDLVTMRLVLQHVPDPMAVVRGAKKLLKHGGHIVILDADEALSDWMSHTVQGMEKVYRLFHHVSALTHGPSDPRIGRKIWDFLHDQKFTDIVGKIATTSNLNQVPPLSMEDFLPSIDTTLMQPIVSAGWMSQDELSGIQKELEENIKQPGNDFISCFLMQFTARKPLKAKKSAKADTSTA